MMVFIVFLSKDWRR